MEDWTCALEMGCSVDILYLDFQKAFDWVPHRCLFSKLSSYGIDGILLDWIRDFLNHWRQRVNVRGS